MEKNNSVFDEEMITRIKRILDDARFHVAREINLHLLKSYWEIGRVIVESEQKNNERAEYGKGVLRELSRRLTNDLGRGFSVANVYNMRLFYLTYRKFQSVSGKLTWAHYCELLYISDEKRRGFYEKECISSGWSVRELRRQVKSSLFERLLLSSGEVNKEKVLSLSRYGNEVSAPEDIIKDPYVFEFLGIPEERPMLESDLENALVKHMEKFLLELGKGFMFVGSQQRITIGNVHYYVDMVFYNKILKAYVLIELKTGKLTPSAVGQLNAYLNYYAAEVNDGSDNPPIGIILCTDKNSTEAEYALGGLMNTIFASRYTYIIPDKEELIAQVEKVVRELERRGFSPDSESF